MFLPLTVTLVSAPGLLVFLVARSSFLTWATAPIMPLNKRALNRICFISDVVPFSREYTTRAATAPAGFTSETRRAVDSESGRVPRVRNILIIVNHLVDASAHGIRTHVPSIEGFNSSE